MFKSLKALEKKGDETKKKSDRIEGDLGQADLAPAKRDFLMMMLKSLLDETKTLMEMEKILMDMEKIRMDELSEVKFTRVADFSDVWTAILNGQIIESPENPRLWSLPNGLDWIDGVKVLYNRACYDEITRFGKEAQGKLPQKRSSLGFIATIFAATASFNKDTSRCWR